VTTRGQPVSITTRGQRVSVVVPTLGRPSLSALLNRLAAAAAPGERPEVIVVDDRADQRRPLEAGPYAKVVSGRGAGPAAARNTGWRLATGDWVAFLDDDVLPEYGWLARLRADLDVPADVGGVQGRVDVPLPRHRRPTDWERTTAGLSRAWWATADMAYRRAALAAVGGFDERFPRAFREDADLARRVQVAGWRLVRGRRRVSHPVRAESWRVSLRNQRGNADDALLRRRYGPQWRRLLGIPRGRRGRHLAITTAAGTGLVASVAGRCIATPKSPSAAVAIRTLKYAAIAVWAFGTAEFAYARIAPGPRTLRETATMLLTSAVLPPLAVGHWLRGWLRWSIADDVYSARPRERVPA
jgi:hypothetical protein